MLTYSHSTCPTARLFFLKSLLHGNEKNIIITDTDGDKNMVASFGEMILGKKWKYLTTLGDYLEMIECDTGNYMMHPQILETIWSMQYLKKKTLVHIQRWMTESLDDMIEILITLGYNHREYAWEFATYKREGSIVTLTHAQSGNTIHIEWFDTEIDSIIEIDIHGNRKYLDHFWIKNETLGSDHFERKQGVLNPELITLLHEPRSESQQPKTELILIGCDFHPNLDILREYSSVHFTDFHREDSISLDVSIPDIAHIDALRQYLGENSSCANIRIYTKNEKSVADFLEYHAISSCSIIALTRNGLESCEFFDEMRDEKWEIQDSSIQYSDTTIVWRTLSGSISKKQKTIILTDDILGMIFVRTRSKKSLAKNLDLLLHLNPWDYVVHREHGIARFECVIEKTLSDIRREYLELHYAWGDKLFVPLTEIYRVSKYVGELAPQLTSLSGKEWERTLEKTDEELELIATELIEIASKRTLAKGICFREIPEEKAEFQSRFPYEYTPDQLEAIDEIFRDMESEFPMDRLLSGDVGFWKTEVAMNAMYKAVLSGYQVAVISPLLVLADEHYETFTERFSPYPIRIECLTRMTSSSEEKRILEWLQSGSIDIVIGTHKLLSENIRWKRLWLLIIDEEHKFWVSHKETIKKMRANIDILALSATPIPRSLNLALSGLKKVSLLGTPPKQKKPIETIVTPWIESTIAHAINYELERGGQIIIIHNRIRGMEQMEKEIWLIIESSQAVKQNMNSTLWECGNVWSWELKMVITHGQMPGDTIEERIHAFKKGEYNILLTTTIIENGVNFLRANTIIIIDPEDFGLAQLHQLRGRVGRKGEQGYCYLIYRKWELATVEKERIITIANNTHLGAGFEIAMRDMEIRGAWDVLGFKQAGKSKDIGLTLYFRMLEDKIALIKEERKIRKPVKIELDLSYSLDDTLFLSESDKLNFFREIENLETLEELEEVETDMNEKIRTLHADISDNAHSRLSLIAHTSNLFLLLRARIVFSEYGLESLKKVGQNYIFDFVEWTKVEKIRVFLDHFDRENRMTLLSVRKIRTETQYWKTTSAFLGELLI